MKHIIDSRISLTVKRTVLTITVEGESRSFELFSHTAQYGTMATAIWAFKGERMPQSLYRQGDLTVDGRVGSTQITLKSKTEESFWVPRPIADEIYQYFRRVFIDRASAEVKAAM